MNTPYKGDAFLVVRGASGLRGSEQRPVFVFQCYLDDSGTSGLPVVTMAGFIAPMAQWEYLEPYLDEIMRRYGVGDVFHAREFQNTKPPFHDWSKIKKRAFVEELFSAAQGRIWGISVTVNKAGLAEAKKVGRFQNDSPISVCFSIIMFKIISDTNLSARRDGVAFLVETGNRNNSGIERYFHLMAKEPVFEGSLRSISFIPKSACRAIQIADFLAFYSRRHMRNHDRFAGKMILPSSPYLQIIEKHVPLWQKGGYGAPQTTPLNVKDYSSVSDFRADFEQLAKKW